MAPDADVIIVGAGLAGLVAAALGPADDRKETQAPRAQPGPLLAGGEINIGLGPLPRPKILVAVEGSGAKPVLQRKIVRVANTEAPLLRRVDQEEAAERPEGLAA